MSEQSFEVAVDEVKRLQTRPNKAELSALYGLYKQAVVGDVNITRPGFFDIIGQGKWDAWNTRKGVSKEEAMTNYIDLVTELKEKYGL